MKQIIKRITKAFKATIEATASLLKTNTLFTAITVLLAITALPVLVCLFLACVVYAFTKSE